MKDISVRVYMTIRKETKSPIPNTRALLRNKMRKWPIFSRRVASGLLSLGAGID